MDESFIMDRQACHATSHCCITCQSTVVAATMLALDVDNNMPFLKSHVRPKGGRRPTNQEG